MLAREGDALSGPCRLFVEGGADADAEGQGDISEDITNRLLQSLLVLLADVMPHSDQPGQGVGCLHNELDVIRVMGEERLYLDPEKGNLIINTLYAGGIFKV